MKTGVTGASHLCACWISLVIGLYSYDLINIRHPTHKTKLFIINLYYNCTQSTHINQPTLPSNLFELRSFRFFFSSDRHTPPTLVTHPGDSPLTRDISPRKWNADWKRWRPL